MIDQRPYSDCLILVPHWVRLFDRGCHLCHLRPGTINGYVGFEPGNDLEVGGAFVRIANPLVRRNDIGNPDVGRADRGNWIREPRRHDAEDLVSTALRRGLAAFQIFERNQSAHDLRIGTKPPPPCGVAEDGYAFATRDFVFRGECAPQRRIDAQDIEES